MLGSDVVVVSGGVIGLLSGLDLRPRASPVCELLRGQSDVDELVYATGAPDPGPHWVSSTHTTSR